MSIFSYLNLEVAPLAASATYTGPAMQCVMESVDNIANKLPQSYTARFDFFRVIASSDQAGTVSVQQSVDGVNWVTTLSQAVAAGSNEGTVIESIPAAVYIRAQYVNGATAQSVFRMATMEVSR